MVGLCAADWKSATIREGATLLGRDDSALSYGVHQSRQRIKQSQDLQVCLETLRNRIFSLKFQISKPDPVPRPFPSLNVYTIPS